MRQFFTDVDIMPNNTISINQLQQRICNHFAELSFREDHFFCWSAGRQEVHYRSAKSIEDIWQLLHEIAHAVLRHDDFYKDIHLLQHESEAWQLAIGQLAPTFSQRIPQEFAEEHLDSYREWLHARSTCPSCRQSGIQQTTRMYQCVNCLCSWLVNDARLKRLRRTKLLNQNRFE